MHTTPRVQRNTVSHNLPMHPARRLSHSSRKKMQPRRRELQCPRLRQQISWNKASFPAGLVSQFQKTTQRALVNTVSQPGSQVNQASQSVSHSCKARKRIAMKVVIRIHKSIQHHATSALRLSRTHHPLKAKASIMGRSSNYSDTPSPCRRNHCPSRAKRPCSRISCQQALTSRLERRDLAINTNRNILNPVLSNIKLIQQDIRHKCDRSALRGRDVSLAYSRFSAAMDRTVEAVRCECKTCLIERQDRRIALLVAQHGEAKRWLEVLKKYRWKYDLDNCSMVARVGR